MIKINSETVAVLGFDLQDAVDAFKQANADHAMTVGVAAPRAHPLVEQIVAQGGDYEIVEPLQPETHEMTTQELFAPRVITDIQFFHALALDGVITEDDAIAAVGSGTIPGAFKKFVSKLPAKEQFTMKLFLSGSTVFVVDHPGVVVIAAGLGLNEQKLGELWKTASKL